MKRPLKIGIVLTRDLDAHAGRPRNLRKSINALSRVHGVHVFRLRNIFELQSPEAAVLAFLSWALSILKRKPLPLQCALYASRSECMNLARQLCDGGFDALYLDTVRCHQLLRIVRRINPQLHIVCDFDDLMSRRMALISRHRLPILLGHVGRNAPPWLARLVQGPASRIVGRYEAATLRIAEHDVVLNSNAVVLVSDVERKELMARLPAVQRQRIFSIPPPVAVKAAPWIAPANYRFVFIGSDSVVQNRTAIDFLVAMWRRLQPTTTLHIFGRQLRRPQPTPGVIWQGFAADLAEVYLPGSILILPTTLAGGIKTKVAEAFAYGCPVLGNPAAFEGFDIPNYPLNLPERMWDQYIVRPEQHTGVWTTAARTGQIFVAQRLNPEAISMAWESIIGVAAEPIFHQVAAAPRNRQPSGHERPGNKPVQGTVPVERAERAALPAAE